MKNKLSATVVFLLFVFQPGIKTNCQNIDTITFRLNSRLSFYTYEKEAEMLLYVPQNIISARIEVSLKTGNQEIGTWKGIPVRNIVRIPVSLASSLQNSRVTASIKAEGRKTSYVVSADLIVLPYKYNEVKYDRLTGGLIVNRKPFFPFGFYCYSPVSPALPEEEVVKGFNMISPYQRILPESLNERKAYMDRCAQLGMKVHYNLLSVSGGGGVNSMIPGMSDEEKKELLVKEIHAFMDHPALLAWYISDEPTGNKVSPEFLESVYKTVKETDPWHPVSIVFMAPFMSAKKYAAAMDIVMADPYPVPTIPVTMVGEVAGQLSKAFAGDKPVWIVPQAFGGGELWEREPTWQEIRNMTYQSVINGARGIQYFVRQGLNLFPKSTGTWSECGKIAVELAELTPWLLSDENQILVRSGSPDIIFTSAVCNGKIMIMAANRINQPQPARFTIQGVTSGNARVLFENRTIKITTGYFSDYLTAFGTQVYLVDIRSREENIKPYKGNLIADPGFENISSPGIPASCYARGGGDRGSTYFLDTREHAEGSHSLRLVTPVENKGIKLRFYPVTVKNGRTYCMSVRAKSDDAGKPEKFEISLGDYGSATFRPGNDWQEFITKVSIPFDNDLPLRTNVIMQLVTEGVAWFDMLQVFEAYDINISINPAIVFPRD